MVSTERANYHHGELRSALIAASADIIRENGIEGFSLREAARRAGVSPGAPAHHFGGVVGLLTEVSILTYDELGRSLAALPHDRDRRQALCAVASAYIAFAMDHPGHFRLMCRKDLIDREVPRFKQASYGALLGFAAAAAGYYGVTAPLSETDEVHPGILAAFSYTHGIAHLAIEDKYNFVLDAADPRRDFMARLLPTMLEVQWPPRQSKPTPGRPSRQIRG